MKNKAISDDDIVQPLLRLREGVRRQLKEAAIRNHRTLMHEMAYRLEQSLPPVRKPRAARKLEAAE